MPHNLGLRKIAIEKGYNRSTVLNVTQSYQKFRHSIGHLPLVVGSKNVKWSKSFDKKDLSTQYMDGSVLFARLRQCESHQIHASLGIHPIPQHKRHLSQPFLHSSWQNIVGNAPASHFPYKFPLCMGRSGPHGSLDPPESIAERHLNPVLQAAEHGRFNRIR